MRLHFNWSPKEALPSPGSQRHGPHNQFFINPALKLCPGCGQSGSGNHVRSSWVFYMLPWHISNLGWPTLPLPTWLLPVQEGKSPGWEGKNGWTSASREGVGQKHQPLRGPLGRDYPCHLPWWMDGTLHFANPGGMTEVYLGKKDSPRDEEARQSLWYPEKRQSMSNKDTKADVSPSK